MAARKLVMVLGKSRTRVAVRRAQRTVDTDDLDEEMLEMLDVRGVCVCVCICVSVWGATPVGGKQCDSAIPPSLLTLPHSSRTPPNASCSSTSVTRWERWLRHTPRPMERCLMCVRV